MASDRFHCFSYEDLLKRDKPSLDITWLRDESLEDTDNLPDPAVLAAEIVEDLQAALDQFALIAADLAKARSQLTRSNIWGGARFLTYRLAIINLGHSRTDFFISHLISHLQTIS
jgi:hypothetical protein